MKIDEHLATNPGRFTETDKIQPRDDLGPEELAEIEHDIAADVRKAYGDTVAAVWISPANPYSNFIRTHEVERFPEVSGVDPEYDQNQLYLAIVDTRNGADRIVHGASIMRSRLTDTSQLDEDDTKNKTGIYTIDSLIGLGNFRTSDFIEYYKKQGIDLSKSIAVETNFKIREDFEPFSGLGSAELTYLTLFNTLIENGAPLGGVVVFATINTDQIRSFERVGVGTEPLLGRQDFQTEEAEMGVYSMPVAVEFNQNTAAIFGSLGLTLPELIY